MTASGVRSLVVKHGCWLVLMASKHEAIGFLSAKDGTSCR